VSEEDDFWFCSSRFARPHNCGGAKRGIRGASSAMTSFTIALVYAGERRWPALRAIRGSRVEGSILSRNPTNPSISFKSTG
jgi:hypothetical protein